MKREQETSNEWYIIASAESEITFHVPFLPTWALVVFLMIDLPLILAAEPVVAVPICRTVFLP